MLLRLLVVVDVEVPGVDVGDDVVVVAGRVILDQARGVEALGSLYMSTRPTPGGPCRLSFVAEAPGLVEDAPGEDARVVEVAVDGAAEGPLPARVGESGVVPAKLGMSHMSSTPSLSAQ